MQRDLNAVGYIGSDRMNEDQYTGFSETVGMVENNARQPLRFALIARNALLVRAKLANNEPLSVVTSYPLTATRLMGANNNLRYVSGGVEAELQDDSIESDAGFELVQSGDSVCENMLEIVEDGIEYITLECVRTPYDR